MTGTVGSILPVCLSWIGDVQRMCTYAWLGFSMEVFAGALIAWLFEIFPLNSSDGLQKSTGFIVLFQDSLQ